MTPTLETTTPVDAAVDDDSRPALVVDFGATANKRRLLSKTTTLIGRSQGCDIRLDAPEVSGVHCLVSIDANGLSIRDCDSRSGVFINGKPVREGRLHDGDAIQIGPFMFLAQLPCNGSPPGPRHDDDRRRDTDLDQEQEQQVRAMQRHIAAVEAERDKLAAQVHQHRAEQEYEGFARSQAELASLRDQFDAIVVERDQLRACLESAPAAHPETDPTIQAWKERAQSLEEQLERAGLERDRSIAEREAAQSASAQREKEWEAINHEHATLVAELESQLAAAVDERDKALDAATNPSVYPSDESLQTELLAVREQWAAAQALAQDLERRLELQNQQSEARIAALRQELERERMQLKQLVIQAAAQHNQTQAEIESLRGQLSGQDPSEFRSVDETNAELDSLRCRVREMEASIESAGQSSPTDLSQYEQELHQFRHDLERAQEDITRREEELETEKCNILEKLKRTELELSRERAAMARDRAELDRLRREFQAEMEHAEREAQTRARLAPIDKLANEMRGQPQEEPVAGASLSQRLGNLLRRVQKSP